MTLKLGRRGLMATAGAATVVRPQIADAGEPKPIRLIANENPYGPGPKALAALSAYAEEQGYLYPNQAPLKQALAAKNGLEDESILLGSGSAEVLNAACMAWGAKGRIIASSPTFSTQFMYSEPKGVAIDYVPLASNYANDLSAMANAITDETALIYVCNPNNPTGVLVDADELRAFCRDVGQKVTVLIDEAYTELVSDPNRNSMVDLVRDGENVVISRTFSKVYGLAGLRIGYAFARPDLIESFNRYIMAWTSGSAMAAAVASLEDETFFQFCRNAIIGGREKVYAACREAGFDYIPSEANFVLINTGADADLFRDAMKERGIQVGGRRYQGFDNWSRVSIGTLEQMDAFAAAMADIVAG